MIMKDRFEIIVVYKRDENYWDGLLKDMLTGSTVRMVAQNSPSIGYYVYPKRLEGFDVFDTWQWDSLELEAGKWLYAYPPINPIVHK